MNYIILQPRCQERPGEGIRRMGQKTDILKLVSYRKVSVTAAIVQPGYVNLNNNGSRRTGLKVSYQLLKRGPFLPFGHHLDGAVRQVADIAPNTQTPRVAGGKISEKYPLDGAVDQRFDRGRFGHFENAPEQVRLLRLALYASSLPPRPSPASAGSRRWPLF